MRARRAAVAIASGEGCGAVWVTTAAQAARARGQSALLVPLPSIASVPRDRFPLAPPRPLTAPLRGDDLVARIPAQGPQLIERALTTPVRDRPDVIGFPADALGDGVPATASTDPVIPQKDGRSA
jgi:hypothetical protein